MPTLRKFARILSLALFAVTAWGSAAAAINIKIDYTTDTNNFFGDDNPQGAAAGTLAKNALDAAAEFYSGILEDTFGAIDVPDKFYGSLGGEATWFWKRRFNNPTTGLNNAALNVVVAENAYVVFVGARDLPGDETLGLGGPGGYVLNNVSKNGLFTSQEDTQIAQTQSEFSNAVKMRGESTGFGLWGGSIAFDSEKNWHFDHLTNPPADDVNTHDDDVSDFYSVALHELAHTLGFGATDSDNSSNTPWEALVSGTNFIGANVKTTLGNTTGGPLASSSADSLDDDAHWTLGIGASPVFDDAGTQTPIMVPKLPNNTRRILTDLDVAALKDLGWEIDLLAGASAATLVDDGSGGSSSFSSSSISSSAIAVSLVANGVPEPNSLLLIGLGGLMALLAKPRRFR